MINMKYLECLYNENYTRIAKCSKSNNIESTVLKVFLIQDGHNY